MGRRCRGGGSVARRRKGPGFVRAAHSDWQRPGLGRACVAIGVGRKGQAIRRGVMSARGLYDLSGSWCALGIDRVGWAEGGDGLACSDGLLRHRVWLCRGGFWRGWVMDLELAGRGRCGQRFRTGGLIAACRFGRKCLGW